MSKHTPGPWTYRGTSEGNRLLVCDAADSPIGAVYMTNDPDVAHSRARMISAAPELLEACKEALRLMDGEDWLFDLGEQLKAAIKKAGDE